MTPNVLICQSESELEVHFANDFIVHIDGKRATTLRIFYEEMAELLEFPATFGFTLEDLNDCLNDLQWLEDERIIFYFTNSGELISRERDPAKVGNVLSILEAAAEDWKWVEEEENIDKKELILVFEDSPRIRKLLDTEAIDYGSISALK
ncbi:barstar family protein [Spirosoma koreense]